MEGINAPGVYEMPMADYLADPCEAPSLSSGVARELVERSPMHARSKHPKLGAHEEREPAETFDRGTAAHRYVLEGLEGFVVVEADDWRTKAAKEERDAARAAGKLPLLRKYLDAVLRMAGEIDRYKLAFRKDDFAPFACGEPERVLVWTEETKSGPVWCRIRCDWLHTVDGGAAGGLLLPRFVLAAGGRRLALIDDYKSTGRSALPADFARVIYSQGYEFQEAFYRRGVARVLGLDLDEVRFRFVVQENSAPHACSVVELDPASRAVGDRKIEAAIQAWGACLHADSWPGYPARTATVQMPAYAETAWIEREEAELEDERGSR